MSPAMLLAASASALVTKQPDIAHATTAVKERTMQVAAPTIARAYPSDWLVVGSASQWFDLNRRACAEGKLLATVFISAKAAAAHGGTIERLRRAYAAGEGAQVQFVFVDVGASYGQRLQNCRTCRTASLARGRSALSVSRVSHTAAIHGLDVALSAFLPEGCLRASPTLLLRSGATARDGSVWSCAATRATQMEQLVADWAFTRGARNTAAQACTAARGPAVARGPTAVARGPANVAWVVAPAGVKRALAAHHT
ncbi:hypothetical protein HYH03_013500 [Edaphochlamys debaryana]|uniref:Uncharacterized protein n=1 Tax=Edaphochlamys debaryana TaxID=47281 RepID=A0A835XQR8_9CHLO|nr:hypothetical protein HYH03_013500 [Edaphochlamys debaryana]|eukprot:KAG2487920.1 hypothetical protein HYH03_013500 [Edaphochlamys debaryana]